MISHFVLMNLNDRADAELVTAQVRSLEGRVPGLVSIAGGAGVIDTARSWHLGFQMVFAGVEEVSSYQSHPAHVEVAAVITPLIADMATCDVPLPEAARGGAATGGSEQSEQLAPREHIHVPHGRAEHHRITHVEGVPLTSGVDVRVLSEGDDMILMEVAMPPGQASNPHTHDHESVGYLVSGRAQTVVDGVTYDLFPGDGFRHPIDVVHNMQALDEGAVWLEIKSPPTRTW